MKPKIYQFFVVLLASFGSFLYGYDPGVIAFVAASDSFVHKFLKSNGSTKSDTVEAIWILYVGRLFAGFDIGILAQIVPQSQAQIFHASIRGAVTSLQ